MTKPLKFDIPVNFSVYAINEKAAEEILVEYLRFATKIIASPDVGDWEFLEFIPDENSSI